MQNEGKEDAMKDGKTRKPRENLTAEERERLEKYGSIEFKSTKARKAK